MGPWLWLMASGTSTCASEAQACEGLQQPHYDAAPVAADAATEPEISIDPAWVGMQLVPGPGLALGEQGAKLRLQWQLSPVLYSFGLDPRLSPWRSFIAEPIVRHSGSIEMVVMPQYLGASSPFAQRWGASLGLRGTYGLVERGDYLSVGVGAGLLRLSGEWSPEYELGLYTLFGGLGFVVQHAPNIPQARWTAGVRLRFF